MARYKVVTMVEEGHGFRGSDFKYWEVDTVVERNVRVNDSKRNVYAYQITVSDGKTGETQATYTRTPRGGWRQA